jgi:hypothetical protein
VAAIERLGSPRTSGGDAAATVRPAARDELWIPFVLAALAFLVFEWAVYERDTLARMRRSVAARLGAVRTVRRSG